MEKSAAFCHPSKDPSSPAANMGLLLLCDVALGKTYDVTKPEYIEKLPEGTHSTHALARYIPDPAKNELGDEEVIIPVGPAIPSGLPDVFLEHGEYVVYNEAQVKIKYLVHVQFLA